MNILELTREELSHHLEALSIHALCFFVVSLNSPLAQRYVQTKRRSPQRDLITQEGKLHIVMVQPIYNEMWIDYLNQRPSRRAGRFAPTPTGPLHIGNAYSALLAFLSAHSTGGICLLRIDDLDLKALPSGCMEDQMNDLTWLGLNFDEGPKREGIASPYRQSQRGNVYESALIELNNKGLLYPCYCTRKEIVAAAPHAQDEGYLYPNICRPSRPEPLDLERVRALEVNGRRPVLRLNVSAFKLETSWQIPAHTGTEDHRRIGYIDLIMGPQSAELDHEIGDFILQRRDGVYAYQLACAVDDVLQGCHWVARGADLITSTHRQRLLMSALDVPLNWIPSYAHAGLIVDERGERLAKRSQSTSLRGLREIGVSPERLRAALSKALGGPMRGDLAHLIQHFSWDQVSDEPVKWEFTP